MCSIQDEWKKRWRTFLPLLLFLQTQKLLWKCFTLFIIPSRHFSEPGTSKITQRGEKSINQFKTFCFVSFFISPPSHTFSWPLFYFYCRFFQSIKFHLRVLFKCEFNWKFVIEISLWKMNKFFFWHALRHTVISHHQFRIFKFTMSIRLCGETRFFKNKCFKVSAKKE